MRHETKDWMQSRFGFSFDSSDIVTNVRTAVSTSATDMLPSSILGCLASLHHSVEDKEVQNYLTEIMSMLEADATCRKSLEEQGCLKAENKESGSESSEDTAKSKAKQMAQQRQAALLATFAAQRQRFEEVTSPHEMADSDHSDEDDDSDGFECAICFQMSASTESNPMGLVCLVQQSRLLCSAREHILGKDACIEHPLWSQSAQFRSLETTSGLHVQSCGHYVHSSCFRSYFNSLFRTQRMMDYDQNVRPDRQEFLCPMCRRLGNMLIPVVEPSAKVGKIDGHDQSEKALASQCSTFYSFLRGDDADLLDVPTPMSSQDMATALPRHQGMLARTEPAAVQPNDALTVASFLRDEPCSILRQVLSSSPHTSAVQFWRVIGLNISTLEVECRQVGHVLEMGKQQVIVLRRLIDVASKYACDAGTSFETSKTLNQFLLGHSSAVMSTERIGRLPGMLSADAITILVHAFAMWPDSIWPLAIQSLLEMLTSMTLIQALTNYILQPVPAETTSPTTDVLMPDAAPALSQIYSYVQRVQSAPAEFWQRADAADLAELWKDDSAASTPPDLRAYVVSRMLPFLRRAAMLVHVVFGNALPKVLKSGDSDEFVRLCESLQLRSLQVICERTASDHANAVQAWSKELINLKSSFENSADPVAKLCPLLPLGLIKLPSLYHDLFKLYRDIPCDGCAQIPEQPALCLVCGALVCFLSGHCREKCSAVRSFVDYSPSRRISCLSNLCCLL